MTFQKIFFYIADQNKRKSALLCYALPNTYITSHLANIKHILVHAIKLPLINYHFTGEGSRVEFIYT